MSRRHRNGIVVAALALTAWTDLAQAQWVFLARHVVGRVEQMSQTSPKGDIAFDTATVIVDVPAAKVFETVQRSIRTAQGITVTREDAGARRIEFTDGARNAGIQAISLGDNLTQLMVSSAHSVGPDKPTSQIVERIIAVCKQMGVECSRGS
ncbi:MAG: hypothetical protein ABW071_07145 [Casimicrobiaceae bacterium]